MGAREDALARLAAMGGNGSGTTVPDDYARLTDAQMIGPTRRGPRRQGTLEELAAAKRAQAEPTGLAGIAYDMNKNILGKAALKALMAIDAPRSLMVSAVNEGADLLSELTGYGKLPQVTQYGENMPEADQFKGWTEEEKEAYRRAGNPLADGDASFGDLFRQAGDHVGFGDVLEASAPDAPQWAKVAGGIAGDVLLDPLTYVAATGKAAVKIGGEGAEAAAELGLKEAYKQGTRNGLADVLAQVAEKQGLGANDAIQELVKGVTNKGRGGLSDTALRAAGVTADDLGKLGIEGIGRQFGNKVFTGKFAKGWTSAMESAKGYAKAHIGGSFIGRYGREIRFTNKAMQKNLTDIMRTLDAPAKKVYQAALASGVAKRARMNAARWGTDWLHTAGKRFKDVDGFTKLNKDSRIGITHAIEDEVVGDNAVDTVVGLIHDIGFGPKGMTAMGVQVQDTFGRKYVPHISTREARNLAGSNNDFAIFMSGLDDQAWFMRKRLDTRTIREINEESMQRFGIKALEDDITDIMGIFMASAEKQVERQAVQEGLQKSGLMLDNEFRKLLSPQQEVLKAELEAARDSIADQAKVALANGVRIRRKALNQTAKKIRDLRSKAMTELATANKKLADAEAKAAKIAKRVDTLTNDTLPALRAEIDRLQGAVAAAKGSQKRSLSAKLGRARTAFNTAVTERDALVKKYARTVDVTRLQTRLDDAIAKRQAAEVEARTLFPDAEAKPQTVAAAPEPVAAVGPPVQAVPEPPVTPEPLVAPQPAAVMPEPLDPQIVARQQELTAKVSEFEAAATKVMDDWKAERAALRTERDALQGEFMAANAALPAPEPKATNKVDYYSFETARDAEKAAVDALDRTAYNEAVAAHDALKVDIDQRKAVLRGDTPAAPAGSPEEIAALRAALDEKQKAYYAANADDIARFEDEEFNASWKAAEKARQAAEDALERQKDKYRDAVRSWEKFDPTGPAPDVKDYGFAKLEADLAAAEEALKPFVELRLRLQDENPLYVEFQQMRKDLRTLMDGGAPAPKKAQAGTLAADRERLATKRQMDALDAELAAAEKRVNAERNKLILRADDAAKKARKGWNDAHDPKLLAARKEQQALTARTAPKAKKVFTPEQKAQIDAIEARIAEGEALAKEQVAAAKAELAAVKDELKAVTKTVKDHAAATKAATPKPAPAPKPVAPKPAPKPVVEPPAVQMVVDPAEQAAVEQARAKFIAAHDKAVARAQKALEDAGNKNVFAQQEIADAMAAVTNAELRLATHQADLDKLATLGVKEFLSTDEQKYLKWLDTTAAKSSKNLQKDAALLATEQTLIADTNQLRGTLQSMIDEFNTAGSKLNTKYTNADHAVMSDHINETVRVIDQLSDPAVRAELGPVADLLSAQEQQALMWDIIGGNARVTEAEMDRMLKVMASDDFKEVIEYAAKAPDGWTLVGEKHKVPNWLNDAMSAQITLHKPDVWSDFTDAMRKTQNVWKAMATSRPGFVLRNIVSSMFSMYLEAGVASMKNLKRMNEFWMTRQKHPEDYMQRLANRGMTNLKEMDDAFSAVSGSGSGQVVSEFTTEIGHGLSAKPWSQDFALYRGVRSVNERAESVIRATHAYTVMERGGTAVQAMDVLNKWHFNYRDLTKFDRRMKDFIPFWSFFSNNIALQAHIFTHELPKLNRTVMNIKRNTERGQDESQLPDYMQGQMLFGGNPDGAGTQRFIDAGLPSMQFISDAGTLQNRPLALIGGMASPLISLPAQALFNRDTLTGRGWDGPKDFALNKLLPSALPYAGHYNRVSDPSSRDEALISLITGAGVREVDAQDKYWARKRAYEEAMNAARKAAGG